MTQNEIRDSFLSFFKSKEHTIVPSASLIPQGDPTLIFTNAGMNQFKDIFLGVKEIRDTRIADSQKCIRVSGKHNDLEDVGFDTYHHTFFEMLGNWSFGDYYKKEAITWAWELLTEVWKLPKERLYATVYKDDDEAFGIWEENTDIAAERILRFDEKDNFWEMGETGPCGPCSEIHFDLGEDIDSSKDAWINSGSPRYIELWNLVFIQYNRRADRSLEDLPSKHVDTGMGFERIVSVLQEKRSNYDTDIFTPVIKAIEDKTKKKYTDAGNEVAFRVIADHIRTVLFSISDGVVPSNEGRGYVIRRILRRALRYGTKLDLHAPFLHAIADTVAENMGDAYIDIKKNLDYSKKIIQSEEEMFYRTLDNGIIIFNGIAEKLEKEGNNTISGTDVFSLYDTYGFPPDLTAVMAQEIGLKIDEKAYAKEMEKQKKSSRESRGKTNYDIFDILKKISQKTEYTGDETYKGKGKILCIIKGKDETDRLAEGEEGVLVFDRSVFYGESGGQVGDTGTVQAGGSLFKVEDTLKQEGFVLHAGKVEKGEISTGKEYEQEYDKAPRDALRKNHTATHLLHKALREVLGTHVKQSGSLVNSAKLRFDFNHFKALTDDEAARVEEMVNSSILANYNVNIFEMTKEEALEKGAIAFFEEKYGEKVRVIDIEGYSIELCGGSHVQSTGEIGSLRILSESSSSSGIRRIEAVTGEEVYRMSVKERGIIAKVMKLVDVSEDERIEEKLAAIMKENKELKKGSAIEEGKSIHKQIAAIEPEKINEVNFICFIGENIDTKPLREEIDNLKNKHEKLVVLFAIKNSGKVIFLSGVTKDIAGKYHAGQIVRKAASMCGGSGGGRPDFAQAGGKDTSKIDAAVEAVKKDIMQ
ncbi:alanine--tRNA ligase [Spirochaetota bacterium]